MEVRNSNAHYNKTYNKANSGVLHFTTTPNITWPQITYNREISPPEKKNKSTLRDRTSLEVTQYVALLMQRLWVGLVYHRIDQTI